MTPERTLSDAADLLEAVKLVEEAHFLRLHGEWPPGGTENWHDWDTRADRFLQARLARLTKPGAEPVLDATLVYWESVFRDAGWLAPAEAEKLRRGQ